MSETRGDRALVFIVLLLFLHQREATKSIALLYKNVPVLFGIVVMKMKHLKLSFESHTITVQTWILRCAFGQGDILTLEK